MADEHPNIVSVREAFEEADAGDPTKLVDLFSDDFTVAAWRIEGGQRLLNKTEYLNAMTIVAKLDEARSQFVGALAIGPDIVASTFRCYRRLGGLETTTDVLVGFRFKDGKVDRCAEICSHEFEQFWAATGIVE